MQDLTKWLEVNLKLLVNAATDTLAQSKGLRASVIESTEAFYDGLIRTVRLDNPLPLNLILLDWIEARSAPTEDDLTGLLPVLYSLKKVTWNVVCKHAPEDSLIRWLTALDHWFGDAIAYLVKLETEALLKDTRSELNIALLDVERLNKNKSDFIAVAAHELKTPLTLIEGYANMLKAELKNSGNPSHDLMLSGIDGGTFRLREIVQDMIDVSLIEMGMLNLRPQPMWLDRLIETLVFDVKKNTRARHVKLIAQQETFPSTPTYGDPERILQVIYKVVTNAIKFTPDGGEVTIHARKLPGFTDVVVKDTGIGISPQDLHRIFEKFSSLGDVALHSSGKSKFKGGGAGLGLTIAKGIIEAHGGTIWAESDGYNEEDLAGSTFHIMVPMTQAPEGHAMTPLFTKAPPSEKNETAS